MDVWNLGEKNSTWYLVETNYDNWVKPFFLDDRRTPANECMRKMTQQVCWPYVYTSHELISVLSAWLVLAKLVEIIMNSILFIIVVECWLCWHL